MLNAGNFYSGTRRRRTNMESFVTTIWTCLKQDEDLCSKSEIVCPIPFNELAFSLEDIIRHINTSILQATARTVRRS